MKILVIGKDGQLGKSIKKISQQKKYSHFNNFVFVGKEEIDLTRLNSIKNYFNNSNVDIVINCAAYTAVDRAEDDEILANLVNHIAVKELANISKKKNISLIHVSTDYVFDGKKAKPYNEHDSAFPLNSYGKSKLAGESALLSVMNLNAIIIRTGWVYSEFGSNFVKTVLSHANNNKSINMIADQFGTPTYANDLANAILTIAISEKFVSKNKLSKIYNFSNLGGCTWFDFAREIIDLYGTKCIVKPIQTKEFPLPAKRPSYSILNKKLIVKDFDLRIKHWKESLKACVKNLK
jgi:dTDP-4-dehydrorhamnose reductase